ncbi:uncharacterized protein [Elaeis guineensis]|uniref:Uncharacterized protein LOC105056811 isoform X2 n=1 Tax=Elaeis guineensis var. tenera TaxID=51953 RepID=A0A6I9S5E6_ELAGV|nr:uncharacterized protein LOC105056811 isoform X2 [Elaeis guineensis]
MNEGEGIPEGATTAATHMESLTTIAAAFLSSKQVSPFIALPPAPSSVILLPGGLLLNLLRRFLLLFLHAVVSFLLFLLSHLPSFSSSSHPTATAAAPGGTTAADRALAHVLSTVSRVPVASRKYELVRSLADRLLDDNLRLGAATGLDELNRAALSSAFSRTLQHLEAATAAAVSASFAADRSLDMIIGVVRSAIRRFAVAEEGDVVGGSAEKLAAEALWLGQKMAECGAAPDAVARWGEAAELGRVALYAEPRLQVALARVSAFLLKHANSTQMEEWKGEGEDGSIAHYRMAMLTSWLPLLCRASNGVGTPILSSGERVEMVRVLEEIIEKLSWEQQEEVLALWLHHFTSCPDSDWPNLVSCYTRWYSESRKFLLK